MSGFLLDTNVVSESIQSQPEPHVREWVNSQAETSLFMSVVTAGELRRGFALLAPGKRRTALEAWFDNDLAQRFRNRILPVTQAIAERWGILDAEAKGKGRTVAMADGLIAATAMVHDLVVVTRNAKDFRALGLTPFNPWPQDSDDLIT